MSVFADKSTIEAKKLLAARSLAESAGKLASKYPEAIPAMIDLTYMARLNKSAEKFLVEELTKQYVFNDLDKKGGFGMTQIEEIRQMEISSTLTSPESSATNKSLETFLSLNSQFKDPLKELALILQLPDVVGMINGKKDLRRQDPLTS